MISKTSFFVKDMDSIWSKRTVSLSTNSLEKPIFNKADSFSSSFLPFSRCIGARSSHLLSISRVLISFITSETESRLTSLPEIGE